MNPDARTIELVGSAAILAAFAAMAVFFFETRHRRLIAQVMRRPENRFRYALLGALRPDRCRLDSAYRGKLDHLYYLTLTHSEFIQFLGLWESARERFDRAAVPGVIYLLPVTGGHAYTKIDDERALTPAYVHEKLETRQAFTAEFVHRIVRNCGEKIEGSAILSAGSRHRLASFLHDQTSHYLAVFEAEGAPKILSLVWRT